MVTNGVFQSGVRRGWPGSARAEGTKMLENAGVFPVWKTPFGTLRKGLFQKGGFGRFPGPQKSPPKKQEEITKTGVP